MAQDVTGRVLSQRTASVWIVPLSGIVAPLLFWLVLTTSGRVIPGSRETVAVAGSVPPVEPESRDVEVSFEISGLRADLGQLCIAVFGMATGFPNTEQASQTHQLKVEGDRMLVVLRLRTGEPQAVAVFQDLDGNGRLSKNLLGIPVEPYGFSRNARGALGPPKFDSAAIVLPTKADELSIRLK